MSDILISAGFLPCMHKNTCSINVTSYITIPLGDIQFADYTALDDDENFIVKKERVTPNTSFVVRKKNTQTEISHPHTKYSDVSQDISKYISNIKNV